MSVIDLSLTSPGRARLSALVGELASRAAVSCGHSEARASAFGGEVASAMDAACDRAPAGDCVTCTLRHGNGPLEVVISGAGGSRTLTLA